MGTGATLAAEHIYLFGTGGKSEAVARAVFSRLGAPFLSEIHTTATLTLWIGGSESNRQSHFSPPSLPIQS